MRPITIDDRVATIALACLMAALLCGGLAGCGGGSVTDDDIPTVQIGPPDCHNHPELCK